MPKIAKLALFICAVDLRAPAFGAFSADATHLAYERGEAGRARYPRAI